MGAPSPVAEGKSHFQNKEHLRTETFILRTDEAVTKLRKRDVILTWGRIEEVWELVFIADSSISRVAYNIMVWTSHFSISGNTQPLCSPPTHTHLFISTGRSSPPHLFSHIPYQTYPIPIHTALCRQSFLFPLSLNRVEIQNVTLHLFPLEADWSAESFQHSALVSVTKYFFSNFDQCLQYYCFCNLSCQQMFFKLQDSFPFSSRKQI